jgi:HAD superfamily hydrolase (TIGR01509 family)
LLKGGGSSPHRGITSWDWTGLAVSARRRQNNSLLGPGAGTDISQIPNFAKQALIITYTQSCCRGQWFLMLKAVIFDFDGIIVDSEPVHFRAFQSVLAPHGKRLHWQDYCTHYIGLDDRDAFRKALEPGARELGSDELDGLIDGKARIFQAIVRAEKMSAFPGVAELIETLSRQLPVALCSGGLKGDILPIIGQLGLVTAFSAMVTAEDTPISKPDPAPYLLAVRKLGLPDACGALAIEDTVAGIVSAKGAGLRVLAVSNSHGPQHLSQADAVCDSLEGFDADSLEKLFF